MVQTLSRRQKIWMGLALVLTPFLSYCLVEALNGGLTARAFYIPQLPVSLLWYFLAEFVFLLASGRWRTSVRFVLVLSWAIGVCNHYALLFRGHSILPVDLLSLKVVGEVLGNYDYTPDAALITVTLIAAAAFVALGFLPRYKHRLSLPAALGTGGACAAFVLAFFCTSMLPRLNITPALWWTQGNGLVLNFTTALRYSRVEPPEGYQVEALEKTVPASASTAASAPLSASVSPQNVIVVMNESLSDLSVLGDLPVDQDYLPFYRSLTENTIKGTAYSSVFGGTTANSEYEFLTGNTTAFLPAGAVPYQMYISPGTPSLVDQMNTLGYTSVAAHPYSSSGWNRPAVYRSFGFDETHFVEDFKNPQKLRDYVSDQSSYQFLIDRYENKAPGEKLFLFNVTMQNHSGYDQAWGALEHSVHLTGDLEGKYPAVEQYLSCVSESDKALKYLLDYFSNVSEPTMVVMFGDHQPQTYSSFHDDMLGGSDSHLDTATHEKKQMVPFLIWANYDIPEQTGVETSLNYLSTMAMETAKLPLTTYQSYLSYLRTLVPVVNAVGVRDADGVWYDSAADLPEGRAKKMTELYQAYCYNDLFDTKNRLKDFFTLPK